MKPKDRLDLGHQHPPPRRPDPPPSRTWHRLQLLVPLHGFDPQSQMIQQIGDELGRCGQLALARRALAEIPDQPDADGCHVIGCHMRNRHSKRVDPIQDPLGVHQKVIARPGHPEPLHLVSGDLQRGDPRLRPRLMQNEAPDVP